jgi:predicted TIM-barrel fold metal-dependent hydrolase
VIDHLRSDETLLWASDWPHWQFDGDAAMPPGIPESLFPKLMRDNPLATYQRLREGAVA